MKNITFKPINSREAIAPIAADMIATAVLADATPNNRASLMLSGGSTPGATYNALSEYDLPWSQIDIGLVDDRWVDESNAGSNGALIRRALLKNKASDAKFIPMKTGGGDHLKSQETVEKAYSQFQTPFSCTILGMGLDGHTASWFPEAAGLNEAVSMTNKNIVQAITANQSDVTGTYLDRMTLTLTAIASSKCALLLLTGRDKRAVFESALSNTHSALPIRHAIDALAGRLTVLYAE